MSIVPFRPTLNLDPDGPGGNIFAILGAVTSAFRTLDRGSSTRTWGAAAKEMQERVQASGSYKEALTIIREYVELPGGDDGDHD